jgi:hypothetical protein
MYYWVGLVRVEGWIWMEVLTITKGQIWHLPVNDFGGSGQMHAGVGYDYLQRGITFDSH